MTYLKYSDICATHVRNALKEPLKSKSAALSDMHARVSVWAEGKRGAPTVVEKIAAAAASE